MTFNRCCSATVILVFAASIVIGVGSATAGESAKPPPVRIVAPGALALDSIGGLVVADRKLGRVVRIDVPTGRRQILVSGFRNIVALGYDDTWRLHVAAGERIYRIEGARKVLVAGTGRREFAGDGGPAKAASFDGITGFQLDHDETIVVSEYGNRIRFVDTDGTISTIAGTGEEGHSGDGGPARAATLKRPHDVVLRIDREVIVADSHNGALRRIDPQGTISTFAAGFVSPVAVEPAPANTIYVADGRANAVYRLSADGQTRQRVGRASAPFGLAVDVGHNVFVSELGGARRVLRIGRGGRVRVLVP